LLDRLLTISDQVRGTNYGIDRVRFTNPVPSDRRSARQLHRRMYVSVATAESGTRSLSESMFVVRKDPPWSESRSISPTRRKIRGRNRSFPAASIIREKTGERGVDVVLDPVGDRLFGEAVRNLAPEGRRARRAPPFANIR
jgi:hypothetical protein